MKSLPVLRGWMVLAAAFVFVFTACGGGDDTTPTDSTGTIEVTVSGLENGSTLRVEAFRGRASLGSKEAARDGGSQQISLTVPVGLVDRVEAKNLEGDDTLQQGEATATTFGNPIALIKDSVVQVDIAMETVADGDEDGDAEPVEIEEEADDDKTDDADDIDDDADADEEPADAEEIEDGDQPDSEEDMEETDGDDADETDPEPEEEELPGILIPDNTPAGISDIYAEAELFEVFGLCLSVDILHPRVGDLRIILESPNGSSFTVKIPDPSDIRTRLTESFFVDAWAEFSRGDWTLRVSDEVLGEEGWLISWSLDYSCSYPDGDEVDPEPEIEEEIPVDGDVDDVQDTVDTDDAVDEETNPCDDGNDCTEDRMEEGQCVHDLVAEGASCSDGNACTGGTTCNAQGQCTGGHDLVCDDDNDCTIDYCDPLWGCQAAPRQGACEDFDACTINDRCQVQDDGISRCEGDALDCDDGNACTEDTCSAASGCHHEITTGDCDDGAWCTYPDSCVNGACQGIPRSCGDAQCEEVHCSEADQQCFANPIANGSVCSSPVPGASDAVCGNGVCHSTINPCPGRSDMVQVSSNMCIDRFEAVVSTDESCDGAYVGQYSDTYPAGFPDGVSSASQTDPAYACSVPGVIPSRFITVAQARTACENTGKTLCSATTWRDVCNGADDSDYPYGDSYDAFLCNGSGYVDRFGQSDDAVRRSGEAESCSNSLGGYDFSGNLAEWVNNTEGGMQMVLGGSATGDSNALSCVATTTMSGNSADALVGFRCCWSPGSSTDCDDNNPCTTDSFEDGQCVHEAKNSGSCDDGNGCTQNDTCSAGLCVGETLSCDDSNVCTYDVCDAVLGCVNTPTSGSCDDGNACTTNDICQDGQCIGDNDSCNDGNPCTDDVCDPLTGCSNTYNLDPCDDGNACTENDHCNFGQCAGEEVVCDDGNECSDDFCNALNGRCESRMHNRPCDDSNPCTEADVCSAGVCSGVTRDCNDENPCTNDSCNLFTGCVNEPRDGACNDNNMCTVGDACLNGVCSGTDRDCGDGNDCTADSCEPLVGCVNDALNGTSCDDGNSCTQNDTCENGVCQGGVSLCDDGNDCTEDSCDPVEGCRNLPKPDNATCTDGNACTTGDRCIAGVCESESTLACEDGNPCTDDSCDPVEGCQQSYNSNPCNDGNACTQNDTCQEGQCVGDASHCADEDPCTIDGCGADGNCYHLSDIGAVCDDNDPCTSYDVCTADGCEGVTVNCDDGNPCTEDTCDGVGGCTYNALSGVACDDGSPCTVNDMCSNGECVGTGEDCSSLDGPCVVGACDEVSGGCVAIVRPMGAECDDNNPATELSVCLAGSCVAAGDCPGHPDMAALPDNSGCIDLYESVLNTSAQCTGENYGQNSDDYPAGFPDDVGEQPGNQTEPLYACNAPGLLPSRFHTWIQASEACANAGKTLCEEVDWQMACAGTEGRSYPYGAAYSAAACNGLDYFAGTDVMMSGGEASGCVSPEGVYDLSGNAAEWLATAGEGAMRKVAWSDYDSDEAGMTCTASWELNRYLMAGNVGLRCCAPYEATNCDDQNPCTEDSFNGTSCEHSPLSGVACEDGNPCTAGDSCVAGVCEAGADPACDDDDPCTDDLCDPVSGCSHGYNTAVCDDGVPCTINDQCNNGQCAGVLNSCDDNNSCTSDTCETATGQCQHEPASGSCNDGNSCTSGDQCDNGQCVGQPLSCEDGKGCTVDYCDPAVGCIHDQIAEGTLCDDGNACTQGDACSAEGYCIGSDITCNDGNDCTGDWCDPAEGCIYEPESGSCDDGSACTTGDACVAGTCEGTPLDCSDTNPCTDEWCDPASGCVTDYHTRACDDSNPCTTGEACINGMCGGGDEVDCDDGNYCTSEYCNPALNGCVYENNNFSCDDNNACTADDMCQEGSCGGNPLSCSDGNPCTADLCDPETGCYNEAITGACNDNNACTINDTCGDDGVCRGETVECDDENTCTDDYCDRDLGCVYEPRGGACTDGNPCTINDQCSGGLCSGTEVDCDDGDPCTVDSCDITTGQCLHPPGSGANCDDGNMCTENDRCFNGECNGTPITCPDDGNECTDNVCDETQGCVAMYNSNLCDDGLYCTVSDSCLNGSCVGSERYCGAGGDCLEVYCNEDADQCSETPRSDGTICDDGNPATLVDVCQDGSCNGVSNQCPGYPDMVVLDDGTTCVDRYEASIFANSDCSGAAYGLTTDDYPAGFPNNVGHGGVQTETVYACSLPGVMPSRFLTWYQAKQACENAGKVLCDGIEWQAGCQGPDDTAYPYGESYQEATCVDPAYDGTAGYQNGSDVARPTREAETCASAWAIYDMSGNVSEWIDSNIGPTYYALGGGSYSTTTSSSLSCSSIAYRSPNSEYGDIGFRCCATAEAVDGDVDGPDIELPPWCASDPDCPVHYFCNMMQQCELGCMFDSDCGSGFVCDEHGHCVEEQIEEEEITDGDDEIDTDPEIEPEPEPEPDIVDEDPEPVCTYDSDCPMGSYCDAWGQCVIDCFFDTDCDPGYVCITELGRCLPSGGDEDLVDTDTEPQCTSDDQCSAGTYCKAGVCDFDCGRDEDCADGEVCTDRGRCVVPGDDDIEIEEEQFVCMVDDDCPLGSYCNDFGDCAIDCFVDADCATGWDCDEARGRCNPGTISCMADPECPAGWYCDGGLMICVDGCDNDNECPEGYTCSVVHGRCEEIPEETETDGDDEDYDGPIFCSGDEQCPADEHCLGTGLCGRVCGPEVGDCPLGYDCDERGRCILDPDYEFELEDEAEEEEAAYCGPQPPLAQACNNNGDCYLEGSPPVPNIIQSTNGCVCLAANNQETSPSFVNYMWVNDQCMLDNNSCPTNTCEGTVECISERCTFIPDECTGIDLCCHNDEECSTVHGLSFYHCTYFPGQMYGQCESECSIDPETGDSIGCDPGYYCNDIGNCIVAPED